MMIRREDSEMIRIIVLLQKPGDNENSKRFDVVSEEEVPLLSSGIVPSVSRNLELWLGGRTEERAGKVYLYL